MASGSHILIVDDDAPMRELFASLLEGEGYETVAAGSGEGAIASATRQRPALVLVDVTLPDVSGYEVCRRLRDRFGEELTIVFVSGTRTEPYDRVAGLLLGADDYVAKPFLADELLARVRRLLVRSGDFRESRNGEPNGAPQLTKRELEILGLLADGLSQAAIAKLLYISNKTVATHIQRILAKLRVHSRAEAVAYAFRNGLVASDMSAHTMELEAPAEVLEAG